MNDFDYDIVQKKRVARGAFAHVNRKRGKCRLPSDSLTAAQKREMNGAVKTYNITRPMPLDEFKGMPDDLQREYLRNSRVVEGQLHTLQTRWAVAAPPSENMEKNWACRLCEVVGTLTCGKRNYWSGTQAKWRKKHQKNSPMDQRRCEVGNRCTCEVQNCYTHGSLSGETGKAFCKIYACLCRMNVKSRLSGERRRKLVKEHITTGGKTLCWTCRKAYGKCSWTEVDYTKKGWPIRFEPVKGWNAIPTKNEKYTSFLVVSCPKYDPDDRKEDTHDGRFCGYGEAPAGGEGEGTYVAE